MLIVGSFEHSLDLEQALGVLETSGVPRRHMLVVAMDTDPRPAIKFADQAPNDLSKGIEIGMACATACAVVGTAVGFILVWGPIFWGLLAALLGFCAGLGAFWLFNKGVRLGPKKLPEVTVIVQCPPEMADTVIATMWRYQVIAVGMVPEPS